MKTLACMHEEDWICPHCLKCSICCACDQASGDVGSLVHVNSLAAANAWRRTTHQDEA